MGTRDNESPVRRASRIHASLPDISMQYDNIASCYSRLEDLYISKPFVQYFGKKIVLIDKPYSFKSPMKISVDMIVISHNPKVNIADLANTFDCAQYVFDGSNSMWKINRWKRACDSLHLRQYSTTDNGAYILKIN